MENSVCDIVQTISRKMNLNYKMTLNAFISMAGYVYSFNKVKFQMGSNYKAIPPSIYSMNFLKSATGKNHSYDVLSEKCFKKCFKEIKEFLKRKYEYEYVLAEQNAEEKSQIQTSNGPSINVAIKKAILDQTKPRKIPTVISGGTMEAILAYRQQLNKIGIGSILFKNTEFLDFLNSDSKNNEKSNLMTAMADMYDGMDSVKAIKSDSETEWEVDGVSHNMLCYAPINDQTESISKIKKLFANAYARRSFVCYEPNFKLQADSMDVLDSLFSYEKSDTFHFNDFFFESFKKNFHSFEDVNQKKVNEKIYRFNYDSEVGVRFKKWTYENLGKADKSTALLQPEIAGRHFRCAKLALVLHLIYDPDNLIISDNALSEAMHITELFSQDYVNFVSITENDANEKMYQFFKENLNQTFFSKDLRAIKIFKNKDFKRDMIGFCEYAQEIAESEGLFFEYPDKNKAEKFNRKFYCLRKILEKKMEGE